MIFYRSPASEAGAAGPSVTTLRTLTAVALAAYPAGALIRTFRAGNPGWQMFALIAGFGLILLSLIAATPVMGSRPPADRRRRGRPSGRDGDAARPQRR
jgi:hypothetical protein